MIGSGSGRVALLPRAVLGLTVLAAAACYRPNIKDGGFRCNLDAGSRSCPEGFVCDMRADQPRLCWKNLPDAGPNDVRDGGMDVPVDAPPDVPQNCFDAVPGCDPSDAGTCDPFCQTGCSGCREKCSVADVDGGASYSCLTVPASPRNVFDSCDLQRDNCGPGLVCLNDNCGGRCYAYCRSDADCPGASCSRTGPGGLSVCDVAYDDACNPVGGAPPNCPNNNQGCYISFSRPTHTLCDCPGGTRENYACTGSRSCLPGLLCVDATGNGMKQCLRVCVLGDGSNCQATQTCHQYVGGNPANQPNATYGFCY